MKWFSQINIARKTNYEFTQKNKIKIKILIIFKIRKRKTIKLNKSEKKRKFLNIMVSQNSTFN